MPNEDVQTAKPNEAAGISIVAFLVAAVASLADYQLVYVPEANAKPILSKAM